MKIAVLAASGHTGRLVVETLRSRGAEVQPLTRRDAEARDRSAVRRAIAGADALVNLAGPFLANGLAPVEAAIDAGIPYVDTTGEQAFMALVRQTLDKPARDAGVPVVNALAYEYAFADLAARAYFPEGGDALHVLYRSPQTQGSAGTKKSALRMMAAPALAYEDGRLVGTRNARHERAFDTDSGRRAGVSFAGGEILTVPTHTPFRTVRTYLQANPRNARIARALAPVAPLMLRGPVLRAAERLIDARHEPPRNERARAEVHLVAEPSGRHVVVKVGDPYARTADIAAEGAIRLARDRPQGGVLAPAEAFDAADMLRSLSSVVVAERTLAAGQKSI